METVYDDRRTISNRVPSGDLAMNDRAAFLRGCSRANFVRQAAVTAACDTVLNQPTVRMSREVFADFLGALARSPEAVSQWAEVSRHAP
jgi:uncharacterized protein (DUF1778 family)